MNKKKIMLYKGKETNYLINNKGNIYSLNYKMSGKVKKMKQFNHKGYRVCNITIDGKFHKLLVHRLVAENYVPNPDNKPKVNHKDGNKSNNNYKNLEWVTQKENMEHASKNGLMSPRFGEKNGKSKITKKQAKSISKMLEKNKLSISEIADANNTTRGVVYSIKYGYTWKEVSKKYKVENHHVQPKRNITNRKSPVFLTEDDVILICESLENSDLTVLEISEIYGISKTKVESILYRTSWKNIGFK